MSKKKYTQASEFERIVLDVASYLTSEIELARRKHWLREAIVSHIMSLLADTAGRRDEIRRIMDKKFFKDGNDE